MDQKQRHLVSSCASAASIASARNCKPPVARNCPQHMRRALAAISKGQRPQSQGDLLRRHASRQLKKRNSNLSEKGTPVKGMSQVYSGMIAPAASNPAQSSARGCMKQC